MKLKFYIEFNVVLGKVGVKRARPFFSPNPSLLLGGGGLWCHCHVRVCLSVSLTLKRTIVHLMINYE